MVQLAMMPTAAKFVASLYYAPLAFFTSSLVIPYLPQGTSPGNMAYVGAFYGLLFGWRVAGRNAGRGLFSGIGFALTTGFLIILWSLFSLAGKIAYDRSVDKRYSGVMDALQDMMGMVIDYLEYFKHPDIIGVILVGCLFGGWLVERTARAWS